MSLQHGFSHFHGLVSVEISALLCQHPKVGILVNHAVKALGSIPGVVVTHQSQQLNVGTFPLKVSHKRLPQRHTTRIIVGKNLSRSAFRVVDFPVHTENRNTGFLGGPYVDDGTVGVGGIEQDGLVTGRQNIIEMFGLFGRVVLRIKEHGFVTQFTGLFNSSLPQHDKPGVVEGRDHDGDLVARFFPARGTTHENQHPKSQQQAISQKVLHSGVCY